VAHVLVKPGELSARRLAANKYLNVLYASIEPAIGAAAITNEAATMVWSANNLAYA